MLIWLWLSALIIVIDQVTKKLVDTSMQLYQTIDLIPHVQLTYMRNQGAAFSFLSGGGGWQRWLFITLAITASGFIYTWLKQLKTTQRQEAVAWALILGGALGNLIDRVLLGYVIDFMDIYYGQYHWPAFNVADSAITIGVVTLLIDARKKN
jgi:signal peptidase II